MKRDPMSVIYIVESKGTPEDQWGYFWEVFRTQRAARVYIREHRHEMCEARYRILRYRRWGVVK